MAALGIWGNLPLGIIWLIVILAIWEAIWKGLGLWRSAQNKSVAWFVCILIFNTVGILPILYIFVFSKMGTKTRKARKKR